MNTTGYSSTRRGISVGITEHMVMSLQDGECHFFTDPKVLVQISIEID